MTQTPGSPDPYADRSFESIVDELEQVARSMDRGDLGVEAVTDLFVTAKALHEAATQRLDAVRARLESLVDHGGASGAGTGSP